MSRPEGGKKYVGTILAFIRSMLVALVQVVPRSILTVYVDGSIFPPFISTETPSCRRFIPFWTLNQFTFKQTAVAEPLIVSVFTTFGFPALKLISWARPDPSTRATFSITPAAPGIWTASKAMTP